MRGKVFAAACSVMFVLVAGALGIAAVPVMAGATDASDQITAANLVITKSDLAKAHVPGFAITTLGGSDATPSDTFGPLAECVGKPVPGRVVVAAAHGPGLVNRAGPSAISSNVDIVQTKAMAKADLAVVKNARFPDCVARLLEQRGASANVTTTSVGAQRVRVKHHGDYSTAVLITAQGKGSNGAPATLNAIEVLTRRGRAELSAEFLTNGATPYDRKAAERILDRVAKRLDAAKV